MQKNSKPIFFFYKTDYGQMLKYREKYRSTDISVDLYQYHILINTYLKGYFQGVAPHVIILTELALPPYKKVKWSDILRKLLIFLTHEYLQLYLSDIISCLMFFMHDSCTTWLWFKILIGFDAIMLKCFNLVKK